MPQKDEAVIDVGDTGFHHIQRQLQLTFQKGTALLTDALVMGLRPFDNDDEVIGIATVGYGRFPLAVLSNRDRTTLLNAEVPCRSSLAHGHCDIPISRGDGLPGLLPEDVGICFRISPSELRTIPAPAKADGQSILVGTNET